MGYHSECLLTWPKEGEISAELMSLIAKTIADGCNPEKIILFGSYATGIPRPESDLDLLLIMPSALPRHQRALPVRKLFRPSPCAMDILVYTPEEIAYWQGTANHIVTTALQSGVLLYERP
ncbi:MAG: nucleotidyltransferase domain-containing protein [Magnetococcales bacterium]|nr:nucleotidyltransferase domain-containing protein [Magnetococcales bacterium]MBF0115866.1 nucleotidyltransferase domain-containing protein [Magnetococcales bacterium]